MYEYSQTSSVNKRNGYRPRRGLIFGLLLVLVLGSLGQAPLARAAPDSAAQTATLTASPSDITICKGQTATIKVTVRLLTARSQGKQASKQPPPSTNELTSGNPSNNSVTVSPTSVIMTFKSQATQKFFIKGNKVGKGFFPIDLNENNPERPYSFAYVFYEVKECKYILVLVSTWLIETGWKYRVASALVASLVPDQDGNFSVSPVVNNTHLQVRRFCKKTPTIESTRAHVDGRIDADGWLDFKVRFDPIHAANTDIACTLPVVGTIEAEGEGEGTTKTYDPQRIPIFVLTSGPGTAVSDTYTHEAVTDFGTIQGDGFYTIITN